ncbi:MAG: caspase family protein [Gemmatimonadetes bacterium]|nr:caspase family protein [Gemmatimonadota bacterium]
MPSSIEVLSLSEFEARLEAWTPARRITEVHVHCTDHPRHAEFRGRASIEAMRSYHRSIGMADIAQHLTIDPQGLIWTGRPFDAVPASVRGHNGSSAAGPFMIEMVGLFQNRANGTIIDPFDGAQKQCAYAVVRAVLAKFGLREQAVKFHREFPNTGKTCPGLNLDPTAFRADIAALLQRNTLRAFDVAVPDGVERAAVRDITPADLRAEPDDLEVPEHEEAAAEIGVRARLIDEGRLDPDDDEAGARGADGEYRDLIGHVVNTSQGVLSGKGAMRNTTADLDTLIRDYLTPQFASGAFKHLLFYAHGGLVSEKSALRYARAMLPWWKSHGVYPIFFVWESSLLQTIWRRPRGQRGVTDFLDKSVELATQLLARPIWAEMKDNARRCSSPMTKFGRPGGLYELAARLAPWLDAHPKVSLHAVGHSTGPIVLSTFMPLIIDAAGKKRRFSTLSYLAPAIRIDDYLRDVDPLIGPWVDRLRMFTMCDKAERDDNVAQVYRKSLLYYVRDACEDRDDGQVLGLQRDQFDHPDIRQRFSLGGTSDLSAQGAYTLATARAIEYAQRRKDHPSNPRTAATAHGGFDNDEATMRSVVANVLGVDADQLGYEGARFPSKAVFDGALDADDAPRALAPDELLVDDTPDGGCGECCCCRCCQGSAGTAAKTVSEFDREDDDEPADDRDEDDSATPAPGPRTGGRRRAVCIGIDSYPTMPLDGCVNDSRNWAARLAAAGFEVTSLHNAKATRKAMLEALTTLIADSKRGDHLVYQYAGHGTQVDDLDGDEVDRLDEALVPYDYQRGALLIDDDIYRACAKLAERPGVTLTFFMDCCHSGSNTRAAPLPRTGKKEKVRYLTLSADDVRAYKAKRARTRGEAALPRVSERDPQPGVVSFAACLDHEFAYESNGHGDFTTKALALFDEAIAHGQSNQQFITAVVKAFGSARRQTPLMQLPADGLKTRRFLGGRA